MSLESTIIPTKSEWKFVTAGDAADLSIGIKFYSVSASMGSLFVQNEHKGIEECELNYKALGIGVSIPLKIPVGFDFATKNMASMGTIFLGATRSKELNEDDFAGVCLVYQGQAVFGPGIAGTVMFLGVGASIVAGWVAFASGIGAPLALPVVLGGCEAIICFAGVMGGIPSYGVSGSLGHLSKGNITITPIGLWKVRANGEDFYYNFKTSNIVQWSYDRQLSTIEDECNWYIKGNTLRIDWNSGDYEEWNLPLSTSGQFGTWYSKGDKKTESMAFQGVKGSYKINAQRI